MSKIKFTEAISFVGTTPAPFEDEKKYISTGAVDKFSIDEKEIEMITYGKRPSRANLAVRTGDIIFAKMAETLKTLYIDDELSKNIYSTGFCAVRANESVLTPQCLYYLVSSPAFLLQKDKHASGATQRAITNNGMTNIIVNIPPLKDQKDCVRKLDAISLLIAYRKKQLVQFDKLVKSQFIEMFGSVNKAKYPVMRIGAVAKLQGGYAFKSTDYMSNGVPIVQIANVNRDNLDWNEMNCVPAVFLEKYSEFALNPGDLVMAMTRPVIKSLNAVKLAVVSEQDVPCLLNQRVGRFRIERTKINRTYLMSCCQMQDFKDYVVAMSGNSLQPNISSKQVENYSIVLPPIELQNKFAAFVKQTDKSKFRIKQSLEKLEICYKALLQKYFG